MNYPQLILLSFLILPLSCSAGGQSEPDAQTARNVIAHYFTTKASVSPTHHPSFVTGDFNGDGITDIAILIRPAKTVTTSRQVQTSTPWAFPGSVQSDVYQTSLVILNGTSGGWFSPDTKVYALLDKSGSLQTPSFQLTVKRKADKEYAQLQAMLPVKHAGDLIVLPTEAGIDTIIYWDQTKYRLHVPAEIP
jgi:hypothetical protein